jgi:hypothetical protein
MDGPAQLIAIAWSTQPRWKKRSCHSSRTGPLRDARKKSRYSSTISRSIAGADTDSEGEAPVVDQHYKQLIDKLYADDRSPAVADSDYRRSEISSPTNSATT